MASAILLQMIPKREREKTKKLLAIAWRGLFFLFFFYLYPTI